MEILPQVLPSMIWDLAHKYWIFAAEKNTENDLHAKIQSGIRLVQFRAKENASIKIFERMDAICRENGAKLLLNLPDQNFGENCAGWHLTTNQMLRFQSRPCPENKLLGASTHNLDEAKYAQKIGADFIVLSPVLPTKTHPGAEALGFEKAQKIVRNVNLPVYFLGGMKAELLPKVRKLGAHGIAGLSAF